MGGYVARIADKRNKYNNLVTEPELNKPLGRPKRRWEDNIRMHCTELVFVDVDWINLAMPSSAHF
jgi:hypothetical protein